MVWWSQQTTSASATSWAGKQEKVGLSSTSLGKETYRAPVGNRKLCLDAASVCEPREETRGLEPRPLRKQCRLTPGSLRERGDWVSEGAPGSLRERLGLWGSVETAPQKLRKYSDWIQWLLLERIAAVRVKNRGCSNAEKTRSQDKTRKQNRKGQVLSSGSKLSLLLKPLIGWAQQGASWPPQKCGLPSPNSRCYWTPHMKLRDDISVADIHSHPIVSLFLPGLGILI